MVDRVYRRGVPELKRALEELQERFSDLRSATDWANLRVAPVLKHAEALERLLKSPKFSREFSRLTKGVELFHSDLVYLRANVKGLERILQSERKTEISRSKRS